MTQSTLLIPFHRDHKLAQFALQSILEFSRHRHRLVMSVEPAASEQDRAWLANLPDYWPEPCRIVWNDARRGYYASVNECLRQSDTSINVIFTTDQVAAPDWDYHLLKNLKPNRFVTSRLIESGATLIADGNIWKNFGMDPDTFDKKAYLAYIEKLPRRQELMLPRHYIPMAFHKEDFVRLGYFTEGRDSEKSSTYREDFYFFLRAFDAGVELVEVQRSLSYHFQGGSRSDRNRWRGLLNLFYPFGLKWPHRWLRGYVSLYDALVAKGAKAPDAGDRSQ